MGVSVTGGSKVYIGTTKAIATDADYATDTFTEIKDVQDFGELGDQVEEVKFTAVSDRRVRKLKGARDAGELQITVGRNPTDPGQNAARTAMASDFPFNFKIVLNDAPTPTGTPTTIYFRANVNGVRVKFGGVNDVTKQTFALGVTSAIAETPAAA